MDDLQVIEDFLREAEGESDLAQGQNIPEPRELHFRVCTRPLSELRRTTVVEMRVSIEPMTGVYLLLRTLEPTVRGAVQHEFGPNILVQVEDHDKNRTIFCLHGHVHFKTVTEIDALLPVNSVFVLKEPFLIACPVHNFVVAVGSPSDFVLVGRSHVLYEDAEALGWRERSEIQGTALAFKWMQIGNYLFKNGEYHDAADAYLFALNNCREKRMKLTPSLNLGEVFYSLGCYESSTKHDVAAIDIEPHIEDSLYRTGRAFYELGQFEDAKVYFDRIERTFPFSTRGPAELTRCEERVKEAEGNVDIYKLYRARCADIPATIDHGNFVGNLQFRPAPGKDRGVFAGEDLGPGTLILVEKPLVGIFEPTSSMDHVTNNFLQAAFRALLKNPKKLLPKFYNLPGGGTETEANRSLFCDEAEELEPIVDVRLLKDKLVTNVFTAQNIKENLPFACHVYELASHFRHSCSPNCTFLIYNDLITVRTCCFVTMDQELNLLRYNYHLSFPEKQKLLDRHRYTCECGLCDDDRRLTKEVHDKREELRRRFNAQKARCDDPSTTEMNLLPIVKELEFTYRTRQSLHFLLFPVYCELAKVFDRSREDWKLKVPIYLEIGLTSVGLSVDALLDCVEHFRPRIQYCYFFPECLIDCAGLMAQKEFESERLDRAEKWVKVLLLLDRILIGGNLQMLQDRFSSFKNVPQLLSTFGI